MAGFPGSVFKTELFACLKEGESGDCFFWSFVAGHHSKLAHQAMRTFWQRNVSLGQFAVRKSVIFQGVNSWRPIEVGEQCWLNTISKDTAYQLAMLSMFTWTNGEREQRLGYKSSLKFDRIEKTVKTISSRTIQKDQTIH